MAFGAVESWSLAVLEACLLGLGAACALRGEAAPASPLLSTCLLLLAIGLLQRANPASVLGPKPLLPFTASGSGTSRALRLWASYAAFLWAAPAFLGSRSARRRLVWSVFLTGAAVAAVGLWQKAQGNQRLYGLRPIGAYHQPFGPFYNHNHAAAFMTLSALSGLGIFFSRFAAWRHEREMGDVVDLASTQVLILFPLAAIVAGILKSDSRMGFFSFGAAAALGLLLSLAGARRALARLFVAGALAGVAAGAVHFIRTHARYLAPLQNPAGGASLSVADRLMFYRNGWEMFRDFPVAGVGLGAFAPAFALYQTPALDQTLLWARVEHVHNDWLELLLETGPTGFCAAAAGLLLSGGRLLRARLEAERSEDRELAGWLLCAGLAFVLHCAVDFCSNIPGVMLAFLALAAAGERLGASPAPVRPMPAWGGKAVAAACLLVWLPAIPDAVSSLCLLDGRMVRGVAWDGRAENLHRLAGAKLELAEASGNNFGLLREAARAEDAALRQDSADSNYRGRQGRILWLLGREDDARGYIAWR